MKNSNTEWIAVGIIVVLTICAFTAAHQRDELKQQAVDRGFAEWRIVTGTRGTKFKWKGEQ